MKVLMICGILCFSVCRPGFASTSGQETQDYAANSIRMIKISAKSGDVFINGVNNQKRATLKVTKRKFEDGCELTTALTGDRLLIEVDKAPHARDPRCQVDIELVVLPNVDVEVSSGSGNIFVRDLAGNIDFSLGTGNVKFHDVKLKKLDGKSGTGDIKLIGEVERSTLKVGVGAVDMELTKVSDRGELDIKSGTGDVSVVVPKGAKVSADLVSALGDVESDVPKASDAKSTYRIKVVSGIGDLKVRKL